jgi:hypothetical protein
MRWCVLHLRRATSTLSGVGTAAAHEQPLHPVQGRECVRRHRAWVSMLTATTTVVEGGSTTNRRKKNTSERRHHSSLVLFVLFQRLCIVGCVIVFFFFENVHTIRLTYILNKKNANRAQRHHVGGRQLLGHQVQDVLVQTQPLVIQTGKDTPPLLPAQPGRMHGHREHGQLPVVQEDIFVPT